MSNIGIRIREERKRLGKTQAAFAETARVSLATQKNYEKNSNAPDTNYLLEIASLGADIQYIVTGLRSPAEHAAEGAPVNVFGDAGVSPDVMLASLYKVLEALERLGFPGIDAYRVRLWAYFVAANNAKVEDVMAFIQTSLYAKIPWPGHPDYDPNKK